MKIAALLLLAGSLFLHAALPPIELAPDGKSFVRGGAVFRPWGVNYGPKDVLLEDFWDTDWARVEKDFRAMQALGLNVVRVHLQFGKFMEAPERPHAAALAQLGRLLKLAEDLELYLDVTGLASYRPTDAPAWYDALEEAGRWEAQAKFWSAVAETCAASPAIFCYDLMNEPIVPGEKREPGKWRSGNLLGGFDFVQFVVLDPGARAREAVAVEWCRRMKAAVRRHDTKHLVTVGLLPWSRKWHFLSGFVPEQIAPEVDFISVHIYPETKDLAEAVDGLKLFAVGKPVVIEETFPLACTPKELEEFLQKSRQWACGWIGHYDGNSIEDFDAKERTGKLTIGESLYRDWLRMMVRLKGEFVGEK